MPEIDFDSLKSVPAHPLPAAEVRRLGDRRRTRRRTVVAVGATAAAVAAVAVLGATLAGGHANTRCSRSPDRPARRPLPS